MGLSDHACIAVSIKANYTINANTNKINLQKRNHAQFPSQHIFEMRLNSPQAQAQIRSFCQKYQNHPNNNVDEMINEFKVIFNDLSHVKKVNSLVTYVQDTDPAHKFRVEGEK